jgi:hypothetical protein
MFRSDPIKQFIDGCFVCNEDSKMFHANHALEMSIISSCMKQLRFELRGDSFAKERSMRGAISPPINDTGRPLQQA